MLSSPTSRLLRVSRTLIAAIALVALVPQVPIPGTSSGEARAEGRNGNFGLGAIFGDPTGLSGKIYFSDMIALDFALGIGWWGGQNMHTHVDILFEFGIKKWKPGSLAFYFGFGPKLGWYWKGYNKRGSHGAAYFGARVPVGVSWQFSKVSVEIFAEMAPGGWFDPHVDFDLDGAVGVRYYF